MAPTQAGFAAGQDAWTPQLHGLLHPAAGERNVRYMCTACRLTLSVVPSGVRPQSGSGLDWQGANDGQPGRWAQQQPTIAGGLLYQHSCEGRPSTNGI